MKKYHYIVIDKDGIFPNMKGTIEAENDNVAIEELKDIYAYELDTDLDGIKVQVQELIVGQEYYGYDPICVIHFKYVGDNNIELLNAHGNVTDIPQSLAPEYQNKIVTVDSMDFSEITVTN